MIRAWPTLAGLVADATALLEPQHLDKAAKLLAWCGDHLADRPEPADEDQRAFCIVRETIATKAAQRIVDDAVQIARGAGVLIGSPIERLYRSVRALRIYEGATEIQQLIIGGALVQPGKSS